MNEAERIAQLNADRKDNGQFGSREHKAPDVTLDGGTVRLVGMYYGDAVDSSDWEARGLDADSFDDVFEEHLLDPDEPENYELEKALAEGDIAGLTVNVFHDEDAEEVIISQNFEEPILWNADTFFPEAKNPRKKYRKWLEKNEAVLQEVYREKLGAEVSLRDEGDDTYLDVQLETRLPTDRYTLSLAVSACGDSMGKWINQTDPGTSYSPYIMNDVLAAVKERKRSA